MKYQNLLVGLTTFAIQATAADPKEYFFKTNVDHFASGGHSAKFNIRYLVDDTYWNPKTGPILFYAGNEGDIYGFYDNSGFMTETVAKETEGLVIFGEHRYFGVSYPYDPSIAFQPPQNVYLTVE
jgi:hypothetical protein